VNELLARLTWSAGAGRNTDLQDLVSKCGFHWSFVTSPSQIGASERDLFDMGSCSYDIASFAEKDSDLLDSAFVTLLYNSSDGFASKVVSGSSLAAEKHSKDGAIIVQAQVPSRPLRSLPLPLRMAQHLRQVMNTHVSTRPRYTPSRFNSTIPYPKSSPLSTVVAYGRFPPSVRMIMALRTHLIRAARGVRSMLIPDIGARRSVEFITDFD
jgi:chitin synthase